MASVDNEFVLTFAEILAPLGAIRIKRMFGGFGLYCDGVFFAIVADDVAYLKGDEQTRKAYDDMGMAPFVVPSGRAQTLSYFEVPGEWIEDGDQLMAFAHMALGAAHRARAIKDARDKRPPKTAKSNPSNKSTVKPAGKGG
ncbi:TfoX/Sxy family protein [Thalassospira sp. MIT1370]|uniref:TfoX/Sxy family protein n=1 Tax=unclassified Thalassospira TaxID=2648997 RepID=UPI00399A5121